jgi:hypothetical protein
VKSTIESTKIVNNSSIPTHKSFFSFKSPPTTRFCKPKSYGLLSFFAFLFAFTSSVPQLNLDIAGVRSLKKPFVFNEYHRNICIVHYLKNRYICICGHGDQTWHAKAEGLLVWCRASGAYDISCGWPVNCTSPFSTKDFSTTATGVSNLARFVSLRYISIKSFLKCIS